MREKISAAIAAIAPATIASLIVRHTCPGCGATSEHLSRCELRILSVEEAATLGLEDARKIAAIRRNG
jgi:hypothetical protein